MQRRYIMTAFGKDRPGIVAEVTAMLYQNGCNLEDTAMTMLSDEFTINLLFSSTNDKIETILAEACAALEQGSRIAAFIRPLSPVQQRPQRLPQCTIHVEGLDQA